MRKKQIIYPIVMLMAAIGLCACSMKEEEHIIKHSVGDIAESAPIRSESQNGTMPGSDNDLKEEEKEQTINDSMGDIVQNAPAGTEIEHGSISDRDDILKEDEIKNTEQREKMENMENMKKMFGENCIGEQTFEVKLSEYDGKVYFVPFAPSENRQEFYMQIIQNDKLLTEIRAYVPDTLKEEKFASLDAVSFYDVNYDGNTDIILIETYGNTSFAAVYYGSVKEYYESPRFYLEERLSENLTSQAETVSVGGIRSLLTDGRKNGQFADYQEAYEAAGRLCELENGSGQVKYQLIYVDGDEIPELAAGKTGYYTSLYTYQNGTIYTLMDQWAYGAMGNAGYEYSPRKNSLRNYNSDYAGAIMYTTYMTIGSRHAIDTVTSIETYYFDDANKNGIPDEDEMSSLGRCEVSYIDGAEVSEEQCASYDMGGYEYINVTMSFDELKAKLEER